MDKEAQIHNLMHGKLCMYEWLSLGSFAAATLGLFLSAWFCFDMNKEKTEGKQRRCDHEPDSCSF